VIKRELEFKLVKAAVRSTKNSLMRDFYFNAIHCIGIVSTCD